MPYHHMIVPKDWEEPISEWLLQERAGGQSAATMKTRRCEIGHIARGVGESPFKVTSRQLCEYFGSQAWQNNSRKGYRVAARKFFSWLEATGQRDDNPAAMLPKVKPVPPKPNPCPDKWIMAAYGAADEDTRLMLRLGAELGLRRAEIASVKSDNVIHDLLGYSLIVVGKGDKQRVVPMGDDLAAEILMRSGYLFPGRIKGHISADVVGARLSSILPDGYTAHSLRHRYATRIYAETRDIFMVSRLLGHENVETTQRYVAFAGERLRDGMNAVRLAV